MLMIKYDILYSISMFTAIGNQLLIFRILNLGYNNVILIIPEIMKIYKKRIEKKKS